MSAALPSISAEPFESLEPEWAALWERVPGPTPFTHPAWAGAWLQSRTDGEAALAERPIVLAVRVEEALVGVAALAPGPRNAVTLGDHQVTDYAAPLALPGEEETVAGGVLEWLVEDLTTGLDLWGIPTDSPMRPAFRAAANRFGWDYDEVSEAFCPTIALPGDFEAYVASLHKHDRHELRRKMRHLEAAGEVAFESVAGREVAGGMDRLLELMRLSRADKDEFLTADRVALFHALAEAFGPLEIARLGTLSIDGRAAAMVFSFEDDTTTYLYNSGYDPTFSHQAVGLLSKAYAIRDAIARGKRTFDFLRGDEDYKRHLGGSPREVLTLRLRA